MYGQNQRSSTNKKGKLNSESRTCIRDIEMQKQSIAAERKVMK